MFCPEVGLTGRHSFGCIDAERECRSSTNWIKRFYLSLVFSLGLLLSAASASAGVTECSANASGGEISYLIDSGTPYCIHTFKNEGSGTFKIENASAFRDGDAIGVLLTRLGAHESVMAWEERRMRREVRATANRLANFDDANLRRSARAAVAAAARVQRAMEILGPTIPDHLKEAGELRINHGQASLEELGSLAVPPMTKDAIAGRIRRLLAMADKRAAELGIPDTESGLSPDLLN